MMWSMFFACFFAVALFLIPEIVRISDQGGIVEWWKSRAWKRFSFFLQCVLLVLVLSATIYNEITSQEKEDSLNARLDDGNKKLEEQRGVIDKQSRYINSLVFNMETSLEGKMRFKDIFETLTILSKYDKEQFEYSCLLCDNGVGLYWFDRDNGDLIGFSFFNNSDINAILGETPFTDDFINEKGEVILAKDSEFSASCERVLNKNVPKKQSSSPAQRRADLVLDAMIRDCLKCVYRASSINVFSYRYTGTRTFSGDKKLCFSYEVDPTATVREKRYVDVELSSDFVESLYGISNREFYRRLIEELKRQNVNPKVSKSEIKYFNEEWQAKKAENSFTPLRIGEMRGIDASKDQESIISFNTLNISQGSNPIEIECTTVGPFPTLEKITNFAPRENLIGDIIEFDLDGKRQSYEVEKLDLVSSKYILKEIGLTFNSRTNRISFASIPCVDRFTIIHKTSKELNLTFAGSVAGKNLKYLKEMEPNEYKWTQTPEKIKFR